MSRWFRLYDRMLDDPKVQRLAPDLFKGWVNLLCLANRNGGALPSLADIAFALRISDREADSLITSLMAAGLLDDDGGNMTPHNWKELQFQGDSDPTNAERQRRFRERQRNEKRNAVTGRYVTPPRTDTETEQNRKEVRAQARDLIPSKLIFPSDGSIHYAEPWVTIARQNAKGFDVDFIASQFRRWCHEKEIEFDSKGIEKTFASFCAQQKGRVA